MLILPLWYQAQCLKEIRKTRRDGRKKALVVMASGLGKTITVALDIREWLNTNPKARILYLCHQNDILAHARARFEIIVDNNEQHHGFYHGGSKTPDTKFLYASFQAMREEYHNFVKKEFDYIVVDESHHSQAKTYRPVLDYFQPHFMLGLTATPDREDMKDIRDIFGQEIFSLPLEEALALGLLTKVDYRVLTDETIDLSEIINPSGWSVGKLNKKIFATKRDQEIGKIISEKISEIKNPKTMIFCPSIRHAEMLQNFIPNSMPVHSDLSKREQAARIQAFRDGVINSILTVDKFNEGIDIPEVNVIVFLRSTQSSIVFYQQLGRGLRKVSGKKKVIVLDFVANAERIEMIHHLKERIEKKFEKSPSTGRPPIGEPIIIDIGKFSFTETAKNILEILKKIRMGYTREILIAQLQEEAKRLRRTPTSRDIEESSREGRTASGIVFRSIFGSWNKALEAAGLEPTMRKPGSIRRIIAEEKGKENLLKQLRAEAEKLKRTPTYRDIEKASKAGLTLSPAIFQSVFGSWNKALEAAGLRIIHKKGKRYSKEELIRELEMEAKRLKKIPTFQDIKLSHGEGRTASPNMFQRAFGSWNIALEAAGLKVKAKSYNKNNVVEELKRLAQDLNRKVLTKRELTLAHKEGRIDFSYSTVEKVFGSWNIALEAAGLNPGMRRYSKDELIAQLRAEAARLQKPPSIEDIKAAYKSGRTASYATFVANFHSWDKTLIAAGLEVMEKYAKEELIKQLKAEAERLKKTPTFRQIEIAHKEGRTMGVFVFQNIFGSWNNALEAAGLKPLLQRQYAKEELIKQLKAEAERLKKPPTYRQMKIAHKEGRTAAPATFASVFGNWNKALKEAGLK